MSPSRIDDPWFGATRNSTAAVPWPETGDNPEIQSTAVDAVQAHSGAVVTESVAGPPSGATTGAVASET
jgi:hypothetical protein